MLAFASTIAICFLTQISFGQTLTSGETVSASISTIGEEDTYWVNLTNGEPYFIIGRDPNGTANFGPVLLLYRSSNGALVDYANTGCCDGDLAAMSGTAPATDSYYLIVHDYNYNATGNYDVTVTKVLGPQAPDVDSGELTSGATRLGSINPWGDIDRFTVNLIQGEPYTIVGRDTNGTANFGPALLLYRSNGALVDYANTGCCDGDLAVMSGNAPATDIYYLIVRDYGYNATGNYDVTLTKVLGPQAPDTDSGELTSGATRSGSINPWGDIDRFTVNLIQGEPYTIVGRDTNGTGSFGPALELYRSNGALVDYANTGCCDGDLAVMSGNAPATDTYYLIVRDYGYNATGNYDVTLTKVLGPQAPDTDSGELTSGATRTGSINPWGDIDRFTVNLVQGEPYYIVGRDPNGTGSFGPALELYRSNGALVDYANTGCCDGDLAVMSGDAPATDTYYLIVRDYGYNATGNYDVTLTKVLGPQAPDADSGELTSGATRTGSISPWGDIDRFTVNLIQGQTYRFVASDAGPTANFGPVLKLYRSNGVLVDYANTGCCDGDLSVMDGTAPVTGTYYLLIHDYGYNWSGNYLLSFGQLSGATGTAGFTGKVSNRTNGVGLVGGVVQAWRRVGVSNILQKIAPTDSAGNYTMSSLPAGTYELRAYRSGFLTGVKAGIPAVSGQTTVVNFQLDPPPASPSLVQVTRSASTNLTSTPRVPTSTQLRVFTNGAFVTGGLVYTNRMTIVLTHGWLSSSSEWPTEFARALTNAGLANANILAWDWRENAGALAILYTSTRTLSEGQALGDALLTTLGRDYAMPIHFVGHSMGALVNGGAANEIHGDARWSPAKTYDPTLKLNPALTHLTVFDEASVAGGLSALADAAFARQWASAVPGHSAWIDNYISEVGQLHPEAANAILPEGSQLNLTERHAYAYEWYRRTIPNPAVSVMGFTNSFELGTIAGAPSRGSDFIQTPELLDSEFALIGLDQQASAFSFATAWNLYKGLVRLGLSTYSAGIQTAGQLVVSTGERLVERQTTPVYIGTAGSTPAYFVDGPSLNDPYLQANWDSQLDFSKSQGANPIANGPQPQDAGGGDTNSSYAWISVQIPITAIGLSFEFRFQGLATNDFLSMGITNENLFTMEAKYIEDGVWTSSGFIDISKYAGKSVELFFGLNSGGGAGGTMSIRGIEFYTAPSPLLSIVATNNQAILSWPITAPGYQLQTTTNLSSTNAWQDITNAPVSVDYEFAVTNQVAAPATFFRLIKRAQ